MRLDEAAIAVAATSTERAMRRADILRSSVARVQPCVVSTDALCVIGAQGLHAAVLEVGDDPEPFEPLVAALATDARTRQLPIVAVVDGGVPVGCTACLGAAQLVAGELGNGALRAVLGEAVARARSTSDAQSRADDAEHRLHELAQRATTLGAQAQTFAHDARVLCGIILGFAANLRDGVVGQLHEPQLDHVGRILEATRDVTALIEQHEAATQAYRASVASTDAPPPSRRAGTCRALNDLGDLVRSTARLFQSMAQHRDVALEIGVEDVSLWCDSMQLKQVVTNLLTNALKFTPEGGRVTIGLALVEPTLHCLGDPRRVAELRVSDTGPGILPADRERVFLRGVRLERDAAVPGTGLGLAVVREVVAQHGGTVHADDGPSGRGVSIVVRLPVNLRRRRDPGVVVADDPAAARRLLAALRDAPGALERLGRDDPLPSLDAYGAIVLIPQRDRALLAEVLTGMTGSPQGVRTAADGEAG